MRRTHLVILAALMTPWATPAWGQSTFDMPMPADSAASCTGPQCLTTNPAGLPWGGRFEALYLHQERWAETFQAAGRADGLLLGTPWLGLGLQYVRPSALSSAGDYLKVDLAGALRLGDTLGLALGLQILDPTESSAATSVDCNLGLVWRPLRYLSLGLVGRDLARARLGETRASRAVEFGLAVRPLWFDHERLTLAADLRYAQGADQPTARFTAQARVMDGLSVFASADLEGYFGLGLSLDLPHLGVTGYTSFSPEGGVHNQGLVAGLRASLDPRPGFRLVHGQTAVVELDAGLADLDHAPGLLRKKRTLYDAERAIRAAAQDESVDSLLVKVADVDFGLTRVQELRDALGAVRAAGKKVFVHLETATNASYYLGATADAVYLSPGGAWAVAGPKASALFLGGSLALLGGRAEALQSGKYKSAVEMFTREEPSPESLEVLQSLAGELHDQLVEAIAEGRDLPREQVQAAVDQGLLLPEEALRSGLVDAVLHADELDDSLAEALGHPARYLGRYQEELWQRERWGVPPTIAVVHARGSIRYGPDTLLPGMPVRELMGILRGLSRDPGVEAVVLRIDSPGGSGLASELLWRELRRLREKKPLIVSMAGVAASGGYYIAAPAHAIVADPATLTGSIGVFSLLFDLSELYARLGVSQEVVSRGARADLDSTFRGRTPEELERLQAVVDGFYKTFVDRVAEGRGLTPEQVHEIAQGRVWTGRQAREVKLVDELGGLSKALALARERIGLDAHEPLRVVHLPRAKLSLLGLLGELGLGASAEAELLPASLRQALGQLMELSAFSHEPALALLPWLALEIR
jgi:protease-4